MYVAKFSCRNFRDTVYFVIATFVTEILYFCIFLFVLSLHCMFCDVHVLHF